MRSLRVVLLSLGLAAPALADKDTFHGFSKDGSWLVYETKGYNESTDLFFCATDQAGNPTWPAALNEMDRTDERGLSCVRFVDPNRAPLDWRAKLVLPEPSPQMGAVRVLPELETDGESPGFVLEANGKKQVCATPSLREDARVGTVYWHPTGKWVLALIDGGLRLCPVQLKGAVAKAQGKKR